MDLIANSWSEVDKDLILCMSPYCLSDSVANRVRLLELLCRDTAGLAKMKANKILGLLGLVDWCYNTALTIPIIPEFEFDRDTFLLPDGGFKHVNFVEYSYAERYFSQITGTGNFRKHGPNIGVVSELILCLCRPRAVGLNENDPYWQGDRREYFSPILNEARRGKANFSFAFKAYFLLFFMGCKREIEQHFPILFTKPSDSELVGNIEAYNRGFQRPMDFGWIGVMMDIAELGIFGKFEDVQYCKLYTILYFLAKKKYDFLEAKANQKK